MPGTNAGETMRRLAHVSAFAVVALLAACGGSPQVEQRQTIEATAPELWEGRPQGASLLLIDADSLVVSSLIEAVPGLWSTPIVPVATNGSFRIQLPTHAELPASLLKPATQLFRTVSSVCTTQSEVADARGTQLFLAGTYLPSVSFYTTGYSMPAFTTDRPPDPTTWITNFVSWVYSTADNRLTAAAGDCSFEGMDVLVDLTLQAGWNQVLINEATDDVSGDLTLSITNSSATNLLFDAEFY